MFPKETDENDKKDIVNWGGGGAEGWGSDFGGLLFLSRGVPDTDY